MSGNFHDNLLVLHYELGYPTSISFLAKSSVCHAHVPSKGGGGGEIKNLGVGGKTKPGRKYTAAMHVNYSLYIDHFKLRRITCTRCCRTWRLSLQI